MDREVEALAATYGNNKWINSFVAKGPIVIEEKSRPHLIIVDRKTPGYPYLGWVGKYILPGGNWRETDGPLPETPQALYASQLREELENNWPKLTHVVVPFAEYFEVAKVEDHGNRSESLLKRLSATNGTVCTLVSVFGTVIEKELLQDELKISSVDFTPSYLLGRIRSSDVGESREPGLAVLTLDDLRYGDAMRNFAVGNNVILSDYLREQYGISIPTSSTNGKIFKLSSSVKTPYRERTELLPYLSVNPLEGKTNPQSPLR